MKDLSLHILDIIHNSLRAKATLINISILEKIDRGEYVLEIQDNGKGIPPEMLSEVADPFTTSRKTRKVGMGLALLKQNAEQAGGGFSIDSELGKGTDVKAWFLHQNIDRPPLGDMAGVIVQLVAGFQDTEFIYCHRVGAEEFIFDTHEIKQTLEGVSIGDFEIRKFLIEMLNENLDEIGISR